jgi:hypothetical protein
MKMLLIGIGIVCILISVMAVAGAETPISMHYNFGDICEGMLAPEESVPHVFKKIELFIPIHRDTPDNVKMENYWLHYYYDKNYDKTENLVNEQIKTENLPFFHEMARCHLLGKIDEALLEATEDTPDYTKSDMIFFQNSISLQTLHNAIKEAKMTPLATDSSPSRPGPPFILGVDGSDIDQWIGTPTFFTWEYESRRWLLETNKEYTRVFLGYDNQIRHTSTGEGFGVRLEDDPGKDTPAPVITLGNFERETSSPRVFLELDLSTDVAAFFINGKQYHFGTSLPWATMPKSIGFSEPAPLEMGENQFELAAVSYAGRETVQTVTITRHA